MSTTDDYVPPPEGWFDFGAHVLSPDVRLEFSEEVGEDGIPRWERPLPEVAPTPEKDALVTSLAQARARREEQAPQPGEPLIVFGMEGDAITFRDQSALDEYVQGALNQVAFRAWNECTDAHHDYAVRQGIAFAHPPNPYRVTPSGNDQEET